MKKHPPLQISDSRSRKRFVFKQDILCFKNSEATKDDTYKKPLRIHVQNISYSGLGVLCSRQVPIGSLLNFNLSNNDEKREMMLQVKWCRMKQNGFHLGLQFMGLTKSDVVFLHDIIKAIDEEQKRSSTDK